MHATEEHGVGHALYVVATPIGNLGDITVRALEVWRSVPLISAEDTRHTRKLLAHHDIHTPMRSYNEDNHKKRLPELLAHLETADLALVTDAGTPGLSDPGYRLIRAAWDAGVRVVPVPGPSAGVAALAASGIEPTPHAYLGFLPRTAGQRRALLTKWLDRDVTLVFHEAPHRLRDTLAVLAERVPWRDVVVAREMTKVHEEFVRGTAVEVAAHFEAHEPLANARWWWRITAREARRGAEASRRQAGPAAWLS